MEGEKDELPGPHICSRRDSTLASRKLLPVLEGSHAISKPRPKIRIIHVFAPEVIKTDVDNFRELVQRLTGKPPAKKLYQRTRNNAPKILQGDRDPDRAKVVLGGSSGYYQEVEDKVKEEEEVYPLVAIDVSRMHAFEAAQLA